jgi:molybdopterin converting factor small subunit
MRITVCVFGDISTIIGKRYEMELPIGSTVGTLANKIGEQTGQCQGYLGKFRVGSKDLDIFINGRSINMLKGVATVLKDSDEVVIMQPTAGG